MRDILILQETLYITSGACANSLPSLAISLISMLIYKTKQSGWKQIRLYNFPIVFLFTNKRVSNTSKYEWSKQYHEHGYFKPMFK